MISLGGGDGGCSSSTILRMGLLVRRVISDTSTFHGSATVPQRRDDRATTREGEAMTVRTAAHLGQA
jgi:hypothetical protein